MSRGVRIAVIAGTLALVALMLMLLPGGYDTDLSRVGGGETAVVMVHDHNIVQSGTLMSTLDRVRGEFEPEVAFLVADWNSEGGRAFAEEHGLRIAVLGLFAPDGELLDIYWEGDDQAALRGWLHRHLSD